MNNDGKVRDQNKKWIILKWNKNLPRTGQWDMGHKPGQEYKRLFNKLMK
ncbi:hypothetical protein DVR12_17665 [Chitinophaga silvatica]|uniref:Toxin YqcG C-terminal domain-containing protein n=1 Tax=Chitinophaga silvatica TaxID=2282649 RepID=A0A3E1Y834_9BACT|nr:hypothetical protein DVR12_17665 [Chitinophaga silvatica]